MKYVCVILDGAADRPLPDLDGRTPLMAAQGEHLKAMVRKARVGVVQPLPPDWSGDPEAALISLFGYDPREHFTGRGPLEAADLELELDHADMAFRAELVSTDGHTLTDPTAGRLRRDEGRTLLQHVQDTLRIRALQFYPGSGSRHVLVWRDGPDGIHCTPPHEAHNKPLRASFPTGDRAEQLTSILWDTAEVLADHPINRARKDQGKPTADMVWPWSPGRMPRPQSFTMLHSMAGTCVAGSEMVRGFARLVGMRVPQVAGATGTLDTDYAAKARAVLTALRDVDFVLVHIASPNEAGLAGDLDAKLDALRRIDERFFGTLLDRIGLLDDFRMLVVVDHATPVTERKAVGGWMPFMLTGNREKPQTRGIVPFDERAEDETSWRVDRPQELLRQLFSITRYV